jgi:hypothetical protein
MTLFSLNVREITYTTEKGAADLKADERQFSHITEENNTTQLSPKK